MVLAMKLIIFFKEVKSYFYLLLSANTFYAQIVLVDSNNRSITSTTANIC